MPPRYHVRGAPIWQDYGALRYHADSHEARTAGASISQAIEQPDIFPSQNGEISLRGPAGVLECVCGVPSAGKALPATAVLCHPHPGHGGTMHNKVVTIMERALRELGLRTVRFNFRGVGASEGEFDDGYGETDDLFAVTEWVRRCRPGDDLWLGGFSFGAYIALRAAQNLQLGQLISIAPAVQRYGFAELSHPGCPWLIVMGDEDELVRLDDVHQWIEDIDPPPDLVVMKQADHFFHRRLMDLRGLLKNGVREQLPTVARRHAPST
jgi:alpha/beta superfamily hydrolase